MMDVCLPNTPVFSNLNNSHNAAQQTPDTPRIETNTYAAPMSDMGSKVVPLEMAVSPRNSVKPESVEHQVGNSTAREAEQSKHQEPQVCGKKLLQC